MRKKSVQNQEILKGFIVFEGIDGSGRTTQSKILADAISNLGYPVFPTAEPTSGPIGSLIRKVLSEDLRADPATVAHLFAADRNEHIYGSDGIKRHLAQGEIVICDRYMFSSIAYQGITCEGDLAESLNRNFPIPEKILHFVIDPELSLSRAAHRGALDLYEKIDFQKKVARKYEEIFSRPEYSPHVVRIDASDSVEKVSISVMNAAEPIFARFKP